MPDGGWVLQPRTPLRSARQDPVASGYDDRAAREVLAGQGGVTCAGDALFPLFHRVGHVDPRLRIGESLITARANVLFPSLSPNRRRRRATGGTAAPRRW